MRASSRAYFALTTTLTVPYFACLPACGNSSSSNSSADAATDDAPSASSSGGSGSSSSSGSSGGGSGGDAGTSEFALRAYDDCAFDTFLGTPGGGGVGGFGGIITLGRSGSALGVGYGGDGGLLDASLQFTQTSDSTAILPSGQQLSGVGVVCAPLEVAPAVVDLASGSLTYDNGTLFLSVRGTAEAFDTGGGCANPGGPVALVVTCGNYATSGAGLAEADASTVLGSEFVGVYACVSNVNQSGPGLQGLVGGLGTLAITESGNLLTTAYTGDYAAKGSLAFAATTSNTAVPAAANESMQVECSTADPPSNPLGAMSVAASTLTLDGTSVVLSFAGTGCSGAQLSVSLLCAPTADGGGGDAACDAPLD